MIDGDKTLQSATTVRPRSPMFNVVRKFPIRLENLPSKNAAGVVIWPQCS